MRRPGRTPTAPDMGFRAPGRLAGPAGAVAGCAASVAQQAIAHPLVVCATPPTTGPTTEIGIPTTGPTTAGHSVAQTRPHPNGARYGISSAGSAGWTRWCCRRVRSKCCATGDCAPARGLRNTPDHRPDHGDRNPDHRPDQRRSQRCADHCAQPGHQYDATTDPTAHAHPPPRPAQSAAGPTAQPSCAATLPTAQDGRAAHGRHPPPVLRGRRWGDCAATTQQPAAGRARMRAGASQPPPASTVSANPEVIAKETALEIYRGYWQEMPGFYADRDGTAEGPKGYAASEARASAESDAE
ncbi:hypothetical protein QF030_008069 [Streptomyces rishiriensis]|uniref:Uncharacterized protein n=1 Tax=Streptomyces rishiriensis TaxID=68264 RepID=A0ABU0P329_STRRH|nr:hypothetical protein [Streptomyces rishiriensis]